MKKNILWLSNASMGLSETFLCSTLGMLESIGNVTKVRISEPRTRLFKGFERLPILGKLISGIPRSKLKLALSEYDVIWVEYGTTLKRIHFELAGFDKLIVVCFHGYDLSSQLGLPAYRQMIKCFCRRENVLCVVASEFNRNKLLVLGVPKERIKVLRYALDLNEFSVNQTSKTSYPSFVFFGRLTEKKNPILLVHAFAEVVRKMPEARLTLIGSGPLKEELVETIKALSLVERVHVIPGMQRELAIHLISEHWVFCQHSVTSFSGDQEGFALSPAEAALLELPIVSSYHNGIPEHVIHGKTGFLAREWDVSETASYMSLLASNVGMRNEMGRAGRVHVSSLCSPDKRRDEIEGIVYGSAISQKLN